MPAYKAPKNSFNPEADITTRLNSGMARGIPAGQQTVSPMGQKSVQPVQGFGTMAPAPEAVAAPTPAPWFKPVQPMYEDPNTGSMTYGAEAYAPENLANLLSPDSSRLGFTGDVFARQTSDSEVPQISQGYKDWLGGQGLTLGGSGYTNPQGIGGVSATLTDQAGKTVAQKDYATDDSGFFAAALAGLGGAALGYLGAPAAGSATGNGAFLGENAASGIPSWDASAASGGMPFNQTGMEALSTVGGADPSGMVPTSPADLQSLPVPDAGMPQGNPLSSNQMGPAEQIRFLEANGMTNADIASSMPELAQSGGLTGVIGGPGVSTGVAGSMRPADQIRMMEANGLTPAEIMTGSPELAAAGGLTGVGGALGGSNAIAKALETAKSGVGSVVDFAKKNPMLAAMGANAVGTLAGGSPSLPALPGAGGAGGSGGTGGTGAPGTLQAALEQHMNSMGATPDYGTIPALKTSAGDLNTLNQQAIDAAYSQQTRMLDPQFQREMQAMEARLAEQGFVPGTPGYERAMSIFGEERTKAYGSARDSSILQGYNIGQGDARNQIANAELNNSASRETLAQILAKRNQPFNELASLKGNQQIDYNNAIDRYNAQTASSNSRNQALSQLALALGMYLG